MDYDEHINFIYTGGCNQHEDNNEQFRRLTERISSLEESLKNNIKASFQELGEHTCVEKEKLSL